jgi:hypothetical protein
VKKNGDIFGIYTPVAWPSLEQLPRTEGVHVSDRTGRSFLFSLVNATRTPYRVPVSEDAIAAIGAYSKCGILLGCETGGMPPMVWLMCDGEAADAAIGNIASSDAHRTKDGVVPKHPLPHGIDYISGRQYFAAEMIEVYHLE